MAQGNLAAALLLSGELRESEAAALVEVDRLSGLGLERLVQVEAVLEELHHVVAGIELGAEAGRVPGGATGELVLLDQDDVAPAEPRQVI